MDRGGTSASGIRLPSAGGAVGGIGSDFTTNLNSGTGSYAIPIELPAGHRAQAPQLALQYSSGIGADAFGLGWSLGGLEIRRDTRNGLPAYDESDRLLFAGEELVEVGGGVLRPRVDTSLQRVRRAGGGWEVSDRAGTRYVLGATANAQESGPDGVLAWHVERVEDTSDNVTSYSYLHDGGRLYLQRIDYAIYRFEIEYELRPDPRTIRRGGFVQRTALRATRLAIHKPALVPSLLRAYDLTYADDPLAGHSLLESVTLTGFLPDPAGGLQEERAPALRFRYTAFEPSRRQVRTITAPGDDGPPGLGGSSTDVVDLEGFGLPGVLDARPASHRYWPNLGNGTWGAPVRLRHFPQGAGLADVRVRLADVDGDARADLLVSSGSLRGWYPGEAGYEWGTMRRIRTGPAVDARDPRTRLVDCDADGRVDLLTMTSRGLLLYGRDDEGGWATDPRVVPRRRDDPTYPDVSFEDPRLRFADMTGDGLLDVVRVWARHLEIWPGLGPMRWSQRQVVLLPGARPERFDPLRCHLADINGDGLTDVLYVGEDAVYVWVNSGESMSEASRVAYPPPAATETVRVVDMLGTGTAGLLFATSGRPSARDSYRFLDLTGAVKPYLLSSVDNGVGKVTRIRYGSSAAHRVRDRLAGADWHTFLPRAVQVVDRIEHTDTVTGRTSSTDITYREGRWDTRAQRFAGFAAVETLERYGDGTDPVLTRSRFHVGLQDDLPGVPSGRAFALRGQLARKETLSPDGSALAGRPYLVESTDWDVQVSAVGAGAAEVLFPVPVRRTVERFEREDVPATVVVELEHDEFGSVVVERRHGTGPGVPDLTTEITARFTNDADRWLLGLPTRRTTTSGGTRVDDVRMTYDPTGLLTRRERLALTQTQLDQVFGDVTLPELAGLGYRAEPVAGGTEFWLDEYQADYDAVGNVIECRDGHGAATQLDYDADALHPVRVTNALGHLQEADYHPRLDAIVHYRDQNGRESRFDYGPLGRVLAEFRPGDADGDPTVRFEYHAAATPVSTIMTRRREGAAPRRSVTYYSGVGNEVQVRARQDDGSFFVAERKVLDLRGLAVETHPAFVSASDAFDSVEGLAPTRCFRHSYDALRRTKEILDPAGQRAAATFGPLEVVFTDTQDNDPASPFANTPRIQRLDALGRLAEVEEDTGAGSVLTSYTYDPVGRLIGVVDAVGPLLGQVHDLAGRVLQVRHRDAGVRRFLRDARDSLAVYVDAEGRTLSWTFDTLGRKLTTAVDGVVIERFTHDAGAGDNLVGRLTQAEDELGAQTFSYDALGRVSRTSRTMAGTALPFTYEFESDEDDRQTQVTYPDGGVTSYTYDALGRLAAVSGLIEDVEYDAEGRRAKVTYTGGVVETRGYDAALGRLVSQSVAEPNHPAMLMLRMAYDSAGNVTRIEDGRAPGPGVVLATRDFEYDALNRLVRSHGGPAGETFDHSFGYDGIGNLVRNDAWRPEPVVYTGARLTSAGADQFGYNANGCLTSRPGMTFEFDVRDLLRRVTRDDGVVVEFGYDYQGRRLHKRVTDVTGSRDTLYVGESFEVRPDGSRLRYVIDPGGGATLVVGDGVPLRILHHDHSGSVVAVRDLATGIVRDLRYTAFGRRLTPGPAEDVGDIGYAGRRFDSETGLCYVRMRYFDPVLGRFVSPDPLAIVDATKARVRPLALNPYTYALDNPLRFTDVNGLWTFWEGVLTVLIVAAVVVATALTFGAAGVAALAIGAGVGALVGGLTTGSVDGALAGAMLGFSIVATVLAGVGVGALLGVPSLGAFIGGFSAGIQAAGLIPAVRQDQGYKDLLGWTSWVNPWTWPGHIVGGLIFIANAVVYGFAYLFTWGSPPEWADMDVSFEQGMIVTTGGAIRPGRAWNFGAFTSLNPNDAGVQDPTTRELILRHERGHSLNNAYFGILQVGRVGAGDQDSSFWEQMGESNVNPNDPSLTSTDKDARRRAGGRGFGDVSWWNP